MEGKHEIKPQNFRIHIDASYDAKNRIGKIAWVVYLKDNLISTNILPHVRRGSIETLEELVFIIVNQIYDGAKIYTDNKHVWEKWKSKNKNRIYLIDHDDNLADALLRGKEIPSKYKKVPTFRFEYVRVEDVRAEDGT